MKPQARPFTVEVKSRRRSTQGPDANWSAVIDEPSLPSRDVCEDAADTPLWAASRVFSAFTSNAISTTSTLADLATSVFAPKPQQDPADVRVEGRAGRILPSLLPVSPLETTPVEEDGPVRKPARTKRASKRAGEVAEQQETPESTEAAASPAIPRPLPLKSTARRRHPQRAVARLTGTGLTSVCPQANVGSVGVCRRRAGSPTKLARRALCCPVQDRVRSVRLPRSPPSQARDGHVLAYEPIPSDR